MSEETGNARPRTTVVRLTDDELAHLDGRCRPEVQSSVDAAKARIEAAATLDLPAHLAGLVADAVSEATSTGRLLFSSRQVRSCQWCGRSGGYTLFKSGPRRGQPNFDKPVYLPGIELAERFVRIQGAVSVGGCRECVEAVRPALVEALRGVAVEVPRVLAAEGRPAWRRYDLRRCTVCGWEGHEGEMRTRPALGGGGDVPVGCPECDAENHFFGVTKVERVPGWRAVVPAARVERVEVGSRWGE